MTDEVTAESVVDRLLLALAAQLDRSGDPALAAGAVEALADLSRAEADLIFGQAGHLVHYGVDTEPLKTLIHLISAVQRDEAPGDAAVRPGDEVRLVGELPESLAGYDATWLLWVSHNLERIADRVTNICERIIYKATGELVEINVSTY